MYGDGSTSIDVYERDSSDSKYGNEETSRKVYKYIGAIHGAERQITIQFSEIILPKDIDLVETKHKGWEGDGKHEIRISSSRSF